jgi:arylsulfatase A-like enzyme
MRILVSFLAACAATASSASQPNIVFILADDLDNRVDLLAHMPRLKKMREEGLSLTSHVAAQPVCGPSRSSMLAGRYPHNVGG